MQRYISLLFALVLAITLMKFVGEYWPSPATLLNLSSALHTYFWYFASAAFFGCLVLTCGYLYERDKLFAFSRGSIFMDILDRLTDKKAIENGVQSLEVATFIDASSLSASLKQRVIGQDHVCDDIAIQIRRRLALEKRGKPIGVFLFAGPPGTGKTYLAKILANELERELLHFDMSQYASGAHSLSQLLGMTKGYVGSDSYGALTGGLRDNPNAIVLLDEIEKAHPDILKAFLTAWNDGFITERSDGRLISTCNATFVLTTNAGTDKLAAISNQKGIDPDSMRTAAINILKEAQFAPEVLNRIDRIFVFGALQGLDVARVAALEIEQMIHGYGLSIEQSGIDPEIILVLMTRQKRLGAQGSSRDLVRAIEEQVADSLIEAKQNGFDTIRLSMDENQNVFAMAVDISAAK